MPTPEELKEQARTKARAILSQSQAFLSLDQAEQMKLYKDTVDEQYRNLARQNNLATGFAAGDLIDPNRQAYGRVGNPNKTVAAAGKDMMDAINFPGFVRDLLVGVFDANQDANERQMEAYKELLKEATKSVSAFVNEIDDTAALYQLVQDSKGQFQVAFPEGGFPDQSESTLPPVKDKDGEDVDPDIIKAKLLDAKLAMAKERRTLLRETLLMGVSRLVVEKGIIRAEVEFKINAIENTVNVDQANEDNYAYKNENIYGSVSAGNFFYRASAGYNRHKSENNIQISTANSRATGSSEVSAKLKGFVEIQFKSDYFKLDNFTQVFDLGAGQVPQGAAQPQQLPPASGQNS